MKIAVGGPSNSGKSTFSAALYRYLYRDAQCEVEYHSLDPWDQSGLWLLDRVSSDSRKNPDAGEEEVDEIIDGLDSSEAEIIVGDAPGSLEEPIDRLLEVVDEIIILANDESTDEIANWTDKADQLDINIYSTFITFLDEDIDPCWDKANSEGILVDLDPDSENQDFLDSIHPDTRSVIRLIVGDIKRKSKTEYS